MHTLPAAPATTITRACKQCGAPLSGKRLQAAYCSDLCSKRFRRSPSEARETRTSSKPCGDTARPPVRVSGALGGLLAHLKDEAPGWIESSHTGRVFPRTYAEHGLPLPEHLRV